MEGLEELEELEELEAPEELDELGIWVKVLKLLLELPLETPVLLVEFVFKIPGANTSAPISAKAIIAATTPDRITFPLEDIFLTLG